MMRAAALALGALLLSVPARAKQDEEQAPARPSFLVLLADDLGWGDLASYGHPAIRTPNLDRLAAGGLRCTAGYAAATVCSPSRAGLLTGRVPYRTGVFDWVPSGHPMQLDPGEVTVAELLRDAGYATSFVGKWHLTGTFGSSRTPQPDAHGFQHWFAHGGNTHHRDPEGFLRGGKLVETKGYSCDVVADEAIRWLSEERGEKPFLQVVAFHEPHEIIESPPELVASYAGHEGTRPDYYASVTNLDAAVGRILAALEELGLADDTLVVFTSDHGPARYEPGYLGRSHGSTGPFRGRKWTLWEGGLRVPLIARWPGRVEAGRETDEPVWSLDLLPTFAAIAGVELPERPIDGCDVSPLLAAGAFTRAKPLHWHYHVPREGPQSVMREGDFVVTAQWTFHGGEPGYALTREDLLGIMTADLEEFGLYDVARDPGQRRDLAEPDKERLAEMAAQLVRMHADVVGKR